MLRLLNQSRKKFFVYKTKQPVSRFTTKDPQIRINERLSFLKSEEEMRKYFNIIDWERKDCEDTIGKEFTRDKLNETNLRRQYQQFKREELFSLVKSMREKLKQDQEKTQTVNETLPKELRERKDFELVNEFYLTRDLNFLKYDYKTKLIIYGYKDENQMDYLRSVLEDYGEIAELNEVYDLMGRLALVEVYFTKEESAMKAKLALNGFEYKQGELLTALNYTDAHREEIKDRSIVIENIKHNVTQQQVLEELSQYGHVLRLEMPMVISQERAKHLSDDYFKKIENTIQVSKTSEQQKIKARLRFYLGEINKLVSSFKKELINQNKDEYYYQRMNNLLVDIKFFMEKFFPTEVINQTITSHLSFNHQGISLKFIKENTEETAKAYDKILHNIDDLLAKYEDKLTKLTTPLTKEEIPIDLTTRVISSDPLKIERELIFGTRQEDSAEIEGEVKKLNFYSTFLPLEEQVAKLNFLKSLTPQEKQMLGDKYNVRSSVSTIKFLDYFIKFSKAIGIKTIDKYIELTEIFLSFDKVQKQQAAKKIIRIIEELKSKNKDTYSQIDIDDAQYFSLLNFLELRPKRNIHDAFHVSQVDDIMTDRTPILFKDMDTFFLVDTWNLVKTRKMPNLTSFQIQRLNNRCNMINSKYGYLKALFPIVLRNKRKAIIQILARMARYNKLLVEFEKNYKLHPANHPLREKFDKEVSSLFHLKFGKHTDIHQYENVDPEDESGGLSDKTFKNSGQRDSGENVTRAKKTYSSNVFSYSGTPLNENQILNRLEYLLNYRQKIVDAVLDLREGQHYKNVKMNQIDKILNKKLIEYANDTFKDNPKLHAHYLEKISKLNNKFKYIDTDFEEKKYKLGELAKDIIQKEIDYTNRLKVAKNFISNAEELLDEKINKGNLVKIMGVYEAMYNVHDEIKSYLSLQTIPRPYYESPVFVFFKHVKDIFEYEMKQVEEYKELKHKEYQMDTLDEALNRKKELIEDYVNKLADYVQEETKEELDNYRLHNAMTEMDRELIKKEYEVLENKKKFGNQNEEEFKDISSLMKNLNQLKLGKQIEENIRKRNKGYAFVLFSTADEAKRFYLVSMSGVKIKGSVIKVQPKFDLTHEDFKLDSKSKNVSGLLEAERRLIEFTDNVYKNLEEKYKDHTNLKNAYKDLYSDPFKKHDETNPMSREEEEEVKYKMLQSEKFNDNLDNTWLFEDEKIKKLRESKDKRITKRVIEWELLKKGIVKEDIIAAEAERSQSSLETKTLKGKMLRPLLDSMYNNRDTFELVKESEGQSGRQSTTISPREFIKKYYLDSNPSQSFEKDLKETAIYKEVKELRERFPKEKFVENPQKYQDLINEVNSKFVRLLKYEDDDKPLENSREELMDKMTTLSPIGKKIQLYINERNRILDDEEIRQNITIQNYYTRRFLSETVSQDPITPISEEDLRLKQAMIGDAHRFPKRELLRPVEILAEHTQPMPERKTPLRPQIEYDDMDTSFGAFLNRRNKQITEGTEATKEEKKNQFDPNSLTSEDINAASVEQSIKKKYDEHIGKVYNRSTPFNSDTGDNLYSYMQKVVNAPLVKTVDEKLRVERLRLKFIKEVEENFKEELETFPSFREYFIAIRQGKDPLKSKSNEEKVKPVPQINFGQANNKKEQLTLLQSERDIDPETFHKVFQEPQDKREKQMKEWLTDEDCERFIKIRMAQMGINKENEREKLELLKIDHPELFEQDKALEFIHSENQNTVDDIEDEEDEYFFNPEAGETLEEHLANLAKTKYTKVTLRPDREGRIIIRREFKNNYKYDLDEIMNFDYNKERERVMAKLKNFDFKSDFNANVKYYSSMFISFQKHKASLQDPGKVESMISKVENFFQPMMENFSLDDMKKLTDNLLAMPPERLLSFINSVAKLHALHLSQVTEVSQVLREIFEFSSDVFSEREIRIFIHLMRGKLNGNLTSLTNMTKFAFIQDVLLGEFFSYMKKILDQEELLYLHLVFKLLPEVNNDATTEHKVAALLWRDYKDHMLKEFTITLKKYDEVKPNVALDEIFKFSRIAINMTEATPSFTPKEVDEFAKKLKEYYVDLAKMQTNPSNIDNLVSDDELFVEEITEQIQKRLKSLKEERKLTKADLVKPKMNEDELFRKQLEYLHRFGKKHEAIAFRDDVEEDASFYSEVKDIIRKNENRKKELLREGKPKIDYTYPRLI